MNTKEYAREFIDKQYREMSEILSPKVISAIKNGKEIENPELKNIKKPVMVKNIDASEDFIKERIKTATLNTLCASCVLPRAELSATILEIAVGKPAVATINITV